MPVSFGAEPHSSRCLVACNRQVCRDYQVCLWWLPSSLNQLQGTLWKESLQAATRAGSLALSRQA